MSVCSGCDEVLSHEVVRHRKPLLDLGSQLEVVANLGEGPAAELDCSRPVAIEEVDARQSAQGSGAIRSRRCSISSLGKERVCPGGIAGLELSVTDLEPTAVRSNPFVPRCHAQGLLAQLSRGLWRAPPTCDSRRLVERRSDSGIGALCTEREVTRALLGIPDDRGQSTMYRPPAIVVCF
jgi:hypothetical protein